MVTTKTKMFAGQVYKLVEMPLKVSEAHAVNIVEYGPGVTTKITSDGIHYMVQRGEAYSPTGESKYPPIEW